MATRAPAASSADALAACDAAGEAFKTWRQSGPNLRRGLGAPTRLVDLGGVRGHADVEITSSNWTLGAGLSLARLATDARLQDAGAALGEAARSAAGPGHRTVATVGGNLCQDTRCVFYNQSAWWRQANAYCLKRDGTTCHVAPQGDRCHAAYSGDLAPALMVLGASAEWVSPRGTRCLALADCYRDDGAAHLTVDHDEVLARRCARQIRARRKQRLAVTASSRRNNTSSVHATR